MTFKQLNFTLAAGNRWYSLIMFAGGGSVVEEVQRERERRRDDGAHGAQKKGEKEVKVMCKTYSHNWCRRIIP